MESRSEAERFENGCLGRDIDIPLAVAAMQRLVLLEDENEEQDL